MNELITAFGPLLGFYLVPFVPLLWAVAVWLFEKVTQVRRPWPAFARHFTFGSVRSATSSTVARGSREQTQQI